MARQTSALPTNKLAAGATVTAIVGTQLSPAVAEVWPQIAPAMLSGPAMTQLVAGVVALVAGLAVGWFVPDRPQA
jgi:uncharacterized protein YjeT (DUF2065 family)